MHKKYNSLNEFYVFYLTQHSNKTCRLFHFIGLSITLILLIYIIYAKLWWLILCLPFVGYSFAWIGHFKFEKNVPATFTYPIYSFLCDWLMFIDILRGRISIF